MSVMKETGGTVEDIVGRWFVCSDRYLEAAVSLAEAGDRLKIPRARLMALALEYRLKAFIGAVRQGTPRADDLSRLASLAAHCGLVLSPEQQAVIAALNRAHAGDLEISRPPDLERLAALCAAISNQASRPHHPP